MKRFIPYMMLFTSLALFSCGGIIEGDSGSAGVVAGGPEISAFQSGLQLVSGSDTITFGVFEIGVSLAADYEVDVTIQNDGGEDLEISSITLAGADAADFTLDTGTAVATLSPGDTGTFTIGFNPSTTGSKTASVSITSNDTTDVENPFTISLSGDATSATPEINVKQGTTNLLTGSGEYYFGSTPLGTPIGPVTFTIENFGSGTLDINDIPAGGDIVVISDLTHFNLTTDAPLTINAGMSDTFEIEFDPASTGYHTAQVTIRNSDSDEDPYTFTISGSVSVGAVPEITVYDSTPSYIPNLTGVYDYGSVTGPAPVDEVFTIKNIGTANLTINSISSDNDPPFNIFSTPALPATIIGGGNISFTIRFITTTAGSDSATITIVNDDSDENPYTFTVQGTVLEPDINVVPSTIDFGDVDVGSTSLIVPLTVENVGDDDLEVTSVVEAPADYTATPEVPFPWTGANVIAPGSSKIINVSVTPSTSGVIAGTVTITSNDPDESPLVINLTCTGVAPEMDLYDITGGGYVTSGVTTVDVGNTDVGGVTITRNFRIENNSSAGDLNLYGGPTYVKLSDTTNFNVSLQPSTPIADGGGLSPFNIDFTPVSAGLHSATVTIFNDDSDENPFTFTIQGTGDEMGSIIDSTADVGKHASIKAVDTAGTDELFVAYYDADNETLKFAYSNDGGVSWPTVKVVDVVGTYNDTERNISLSVDTSATNNIGISYYDETSQSLEFAFSSNNGTDWNRYTVDTGNVGKYASLAIYNNAGTIYAYISYYDAGTPALKFATDNSGTSWTGWNSYTADNSANVGQYSSIGIYDDTTNVHAYISYYDVASSALKFATADDSDWSGNGPPWQAPNGYIVQVDNSADVGQYSSIAVYDDGFNVNAYISYYDTTGRLYFATADDGDWSGGGPPWSNINLADNTVDRGQYSSIAVYDDGANVNAYISYYDASNLDLYFATADDGDWSGGGPPWGVPVSVDSVQDVGEFSCIAYDGAAVPANRNLYIIYYDSTSNVLRITRSDMTGAIWTAP